MYKKALTETDIRTKKFITSAVSGKTVKRGRAKKAEYVFTKGAPTTHVWYYEHPYPPGQKSYSKRLSVPGEARKKTASRKSTTHQPKPTPAEMLKS